MNDKVREAIERLKGIGQHRTFEGEYVADFIERLDRVIEVKGIRVDGNKLQILVGEPRSINQEDVLKVVTKASLLNVSASGYEEKPYGKVLYFEYYLPPWEGLEL